MIYLSNYTAMPAKGWHHCTVDYDVPMAGEWEDGSRFVRGDSAGLDLWHIDVFAEVAPGTVKTLDFAKVHKRSYKIGDLPDDWYTFFGTPTCCGVKMSVVSLHPNGAHYDCHLRARVTPMLCVDLRCRWYPQMRNLLLGSLAITASNGSVPDMGDTVPADFYLKLADAWTITVIGLDKLRGQWIADGPSQILPFTAFRSPVSPEHLPLMTPGGTGVVGLERVWPTGNPYPNPAPLPWARERLSKALSCFGGWDHAWIGVVPDAGSAGGQEDQVFVGTESQTPRGLGAETVRLWTAWQQARRPVQHLEADGSPLDIDAHPDLAMWSCRAHYDTNVSKDQLGKARPLTKADTHGWWGPDEEHILWNTVCVAARLTGDPAVQWMLQHRARGLIFHLRGHDRPGALRAVGWRSLAAWWLWHALEDRALAEKVKAHWLAFADMVVDQWSQKPWWWVDMVHPGMTAATGKIHNTMTWQHGLACYGLDLAGECFGHRNARTLARSGATIATEEAWTWYDEKHRYKGWCYVGTDDGVYGPLVQGNGAFWGPGVEVWMTLGIATVMRHDPQHPKAKAIWAQLLDEANQHGKWLPPELLVEGDVYR